MKRMRRTYHTLPILSIIVPVYNVGKYLEQCIQSICTNQLDPEEEIILVNDGSTDHSGKICDIYVQKYSNITVLHTKHKGASAARNEGMRHARGNYILFIDADDYIAKSSLARLKKEIQDGADFYFLHIKKVYPNGNVQLLEKIEDHNLKNHDKSYCIKYISSLSKFPGSACAKLVRREVILKHKIYFEEGVIAEDLIWTLKCILYANTYRSLDFSFYYYRQMRRGSVTSVTTIRSIEHLQHAILQGVILANCQEFCEFQDEIYCMMAYETEILILLYGGLNQSERVKYKRMVESVYWLLYYRRRKKTTGIRLLIRLTGLNRGAWMINRLWKCIQMHGLSAQSLPQRSEGIYRADCMKM